jgi:hypothetical protein
MEQAAPDTSYGHIQIDGKTPNLYVISELIDDDIYLERYFSGDN